MNDPVNLNDSTGTQVDATLWLAYWGGMIFAGGFPDWSLFSSGGGPQSFFFDPLGWVEDPKTGNWGLLYSTGSIHCAIVYIQPSNSAACFFSPSAGTSLDTECRRSIVDGETQPLSFG
jgi:hypothetical protein